MWPKAQACLLPQDQPDRRRGLKALLLLAETSRMELERHGIDHHSLTDKELKRGIHKSLRGGSISFNQYLNNTRNPRRSFLEWATQELGWWLLILATGVVSFMFSPPFLILPVLLLLAYCIGRTTRSRFFLAVCLIPAPFLIICLILSQADSWHEIPARLGWSSVRDKGYR
ncbi:hypothetical protein F4859DRAFT_459565 [Xylaria cf. heliscus]|nr:hypothetical protein F4859DRAFT_459565 [Xylaria cf. heliscus]